MIRNLLPWLLPLLLFVHCSQPEVVFEDALCIQNISTIDPIEGIKENQTIIIREGKILKIAPSSELRLSSSNQIIDGTGRFMIPGLWDAHIHFSYIEELAPDMFDLFLVYGITSVRDTGGQIDFVKKWKNKAEANPTNAPRVMIAGPLLDGQPNVYDGSDPGHPPLSVGLSSLNDVAHQIELLDSIGVDFLKAYEMLTPDQFSLVTKMARERGLKVTGHVPLSMDVITASNQGLNSMEHMRNLELSCASNSEELLAQRRQLLLEGKNTPGGVLRSRIHQAQRQSAIENYDPVKAAKVLDVLAKNQTWQIPTMALNTVFIDRPFMEPHWQESFTYLPDSIGKSWNKIIQEYMDTEVSAFRIQHAQWMTNMIFNIHEAGIGIMAGTDTPIAFLTPGLSLHEELNTLASAGIPPLEVLKTATTNPAKYFNLENSLGSIKENMWADLLILNANPLDDINNTKNINAVIKQGKLYDRDQLDLIIKRLKDN
jgi:imidazolonepropionase-like amidohydrolase